MAAETGCQIVIRGDKDGDGGVGALCKGAAASCSDHHLEEVSR